MAAMAALRALRRAVLPVVVGLASTVGVGVGAGAGHAAPATPVGMGPGGPSVPTIRDLRWVRVDPRDPRTVFVGGADLFSRSTDAGATWADLRPALNVTGGCGPMGAGTVVRTSPLLIAPDGRHLLFEVTCSPVGPRDGYTDIIASADGGLHWRQVGNLDTMTGVGHLDVQYDKPALGPVPNTPGTVGARLYARRTTYENDGVYAQGVGSAVSYSDDGGATWRDGNDPITATADYSLTSIIGSVVPDPARPSTVYANVSAEYDGPAVYHQDPFVARSDDAGLHWTLVAAPTVAPPLPPLRTFTVTTDPREGAALVGLTADAGVPADRVYLSRDGGRTWRAATCPGDIKGACPRAVVDGGFGAGASYGFVGDGVYRFHGGGPAVARLAVSKALPFVSAAIMDAAAGPRAGDPIYLLGHGTLGDAHDGALYAHGLLLRGADGGKSWRGLPANPLPNVAPPSRAPGALYVPAARHSVAAPFVAAYRRLGLYVLGDPVTEAYTRGGALAQDFDRLRLELRGGRVVVGALGSDVAGYEGLRFAPVAPVAGTPARLYFPATRHTLEGDLLRYWRAHGGLAVFGAPIGEVVRMRNGDGSGRAYELQWFQNARLERHPETRDPRFAILPGLLGPASLRGRGWTV